MLGEISIKIRGTNIIIRLTPKLARNQKKWERQKRKPRIDRERKRGQERKMLV
jgi:hypothetical protein